MRELSLENIQSYDEFLFEYLDISQKLAGVMILVDNKVLLVKPKKFKDKEEEWSIPKGKVNKESIIDTAVKELREETGITIPKESLKNTEKTKVIYKKGEKIKELVVFILRLDKKELTVDMNKKWEVLKKHFDTDEVYKAKFFTKKQAMNKLEPGQISLIKFM